MKRLIDANALEFSRVRIAHEDGTIGGYNAVVMSSVINNAPTIDAIPIAYIEKCIAELDTWIPKFKKENTGNLILTKEYLKWILNWWKFMNKEYINE